jgi:hypothetical protein
VSKIHDEYTDKVARHGCIVCIALGYETPAGIHHVRKLATSKKRDRAPIIPLCGIHHQTGGYGVAVHAGEGAWEAAFGSVLGMVAEIEEVYGPIPQK